jgi:tight adherence protein B
MHLLLAALVFITILLIFAGIYVFMKGPEEGAIIRNRLEAIEKGAQFSPHALDLSLIRDEMLSGIPALNKMLVRWLWPARMRGFIGQAGMQVRPGVLTLLSAVIGLAAFEAVEILYRKWWLAVVAAASVALLPLIYVALKRAQRLAAFERLFPEVIDLLSRSVRAGHAFTSGMEIVATDLPDPVSTEFRITFDEQRFGLPLRDALTNLCERVPLVDVRLFVIALLVQKETGGNLAELLDNLARVIRERFKIAGEVRVRTAQGRLTAIILVALPIFMIMMLHVINPSYVDLLFVDRLGQIMLIVAAIMQTLGGIIIWRIVKIKV